MRMTAEGFDWICRTCAFKTRTREALRLLWLEGYSFAATAAEMQVQDLSLQKLLGRAKHRIHARRTSCSPAETTLWDTYMPRVGEEEPERETERQHAANLLHVQKGRRRHNPQAMELDELGRPIAGHPPLISVEEAMRLCQQVATGRHALL